MERACKAPSRVFAQVVERGVSVLSQQKSKIRKTDILISTDSTEINQDKARKCLFSNLIYWEGDREEMGGGGGSGRQKASNLIQGS